ncbi:G-protein coupled receptor moody-like [Lytechinus pictus]|uniref:G-protein coupled receptor moody-like n=1 Tax=Lytechinus pictus TaxID=7653 RepID=UPI0030B9CFE4
MNVATTVSVNNSANESVDPENIIPRIALSGWLGFVGVVGFFGNLLIVSVVVIYPKLRTITNVYVTSLAMADMMTCLTIPFTIVGVVSTTGWPLSDASCVLVAVVSFVCTGSSVWHLAIIGFNRMVLITMTSSRYRKIFSKSHVLIFLLVTWFIPLSVILVPYLGGFTRLGYSDGPHTCSDIEENEDGSENLIHTYLQATFLTCFPLALVLFFYFRIFIFIRKHERNKNTWKTNSLTRESVPPSFGRKLAADTAGTSQSMTPIGSNDAAVPGASSVKETAQTLSTSGNNKVNPTAATKNNSRNSLEYKITKNAFYVVLGFLLCVIPYGICILGGYGPGGTPLALAFLLFNSCLNPLIYGTKHPQFRSSLGKLFRGRFTGPLFTSHAVGPVDH